VDWSDAEIEYVVETNAFSPSGAAEPWRRGFEDLCTFVDENANGSSCVYLDTTTIWTALQLTSGDASILHASTVMDLDKVTRAVVLNDRVFHMPSPYLAPNVVNQVLGEDVLVALAPISSQPALARVIWDIWYYAAPDVANALTTRPAGLMEECRSADSRHLFSDLASFYGFDLAESDWKIEADGSPTFTSDPPTLVAHLLDDGKYGDNLLATGPGGQVLKSILTSPGKRRDLVVDDTHELVHRATFNQLLADALGLVYDPSFARMPAIHHIVRNSKDVALALADLDMLQALIGERLHTVTSAALVEASSPMNIPPFTAYALTKARNPTQWWEVLGDLRRQSASYRRKRRDLQEALFVGDLKTISQLRQELVGSSVGMSDANIDAALDVAFDAAKASVSMIPGPPAAFAGPIAQALRLVIGKPVKAAVKALRRRLKPELRLFYDVASAATSCMKMENRIRLLWDVDQLPASIGDLAGYVERSRAITD
jgi:hypothetical protein